ncbi:conserved hypothetical protein [Carnobacterium maltaromaticum]|uniref:hypothetical protein n=1 Tax=Carnobacterium maltaromaticum TaxID=2751 RepID=UPI00191BB446|nr:hypothetical protein [Carnobacterium maltaromaticum]CAD5900449.1 conserved hypothetical protein [Carnobacterium maltaromaticum]
MKIEDYWEDINTYYIEFLTGKYSRKISKILSFSGNPSVEEIESIIYTYFKKVDKVIVIEFWEEGLLLKNKITYEA